MVKSRIVLSLVALFSVKLALAQAPSERRFALIVGNDLGGFGTQPLLYAREDARRMHDALVRLGGLAPQDARLVLGRSASEVWRAFTELEAGMRTATGTGTRVAFIFYYSGHAKEGVLQLGNSRLALAELKERISKSPAELRLAIIDSCRSGAVTRLKGARRGPAFDIETTEANATGIPGNARGTVFLTSSSFDEDSQESDHIGGSYFSYHLVSALQGEADRSGDGFVTLSEAYAYTYARTVADTASSAAGPQHPTFSYDLKGNGDFVLSSYGARNEGLILPAAAPEGLYFVVNAAGVIAAEIAKPANQSRRVAVPPGRYTIKRRMPDRLRIGQIRIARGQLLILDEQTLRDAPFSDDPVKGVDRDVRSQWSLSLGAGAQSFFDAPTQEALFPPASLISLEAVLGGFLRHDFALGFDVASGRGPGTVTTPGFDARFWMNQLLLGASFMKTWPLWDGDFTPFLGARLAFVFITRRFEDHAFAEQFFSTFSPGVVLGARYRLSRRMFALARGRISYLHYNVDENRSLGFCELGLALGYDF